MEGVVTQILWGYLDTQILGSGITWWLGSVRWHDLDTQVLWGRATCTYCAWNPDPVFCLMTDLQSSPRFGSRRFSPWHLGLCYNAWHLSHGLVFLFQLSTARWCGGPGLRGTSLRWNATCHDLNYKELKFYVFKICMQWRLISACGCSHISRILNVHWHVGSKSTIDLFPQNI